MSPFKGDYHHSFVLSVSQMYCSFVYCMLNMLNLYLEVKSSDKVHS